MNNDLEFSSLLIPIDNKSKGLLRFSIEQKIKLLELKIELHKLLFDLNDVKLVNTIMKGIIERCDQNPLNNDSIFSSISTKTINTFTYNYYQLEDLSMKFKFINQYTDLNEEIELPGEIFKCKMTLFVRDIKRMQRFIDSFLFNYPIILDTLRFVDRRTSSLSIPAADSGKLFEEPVKPAVEEESQLIEPEQTTTIDEILEFLIISPQILSYVIHLILNFYRFFDMSHIEKTDGKMTISFNSIFPNRITINKPFIIGLLNSIESCSLDTVNLHTKNLAKFIFNYYDKLTSVELSCCNYIFLFFSIRHLLETHRTWVYNNIDKVFCSPEHQCKLLNKYIAKISGLPIVFEICDIESTENVDIKHVSEKYAYMKSIDQEKFAEFVFNDLDQDDSLPPNLPTIGIKTILNVENLLNNKVTDNEFIERQRSDLAAVTAYKKHKDEKVITDAFELFLEYVENPVILVTKKDESSLIPNNVINCFEKLKSLLNDNNFKKENINTQYYYEKLIEVLPPDFQFTNILYIIFQIIVPYMYYFHNVKLFEDVFLTTYKI